MLPVRCRCVSGGRDHGLFTTGSLHGLLGGGDVQAQLLEAFLQGIKQLQTLEDSSVPGGSDGRRRRTWSLGEPRQDSSPPRGGGGETPADGGGRSSRHSSRHSSCSADESRDGNESSSEADEAESGWGGLGSEDPLVAIRGLGGGGGAAYEPPLLVPVPDPQLMIGGHGVDFMRGVVAIKAELGCSAAELGGELGGELSCSAAELASLVSCPLDHVARQVVVHLSRRERGLPDLPTHLPFDVSAHEDAASLVGRQTIRRLQTDLADHAQRVNTESVPALGFLTDERAAKVVAEVEAALRAHASSAHLQPRASGASGARPAPPPTIECASALAAARELRASLLSMLRADLAAISRGGSALEEFVNSAAERGAQGTMASRVHALLLDGGGTRRLRLPLLLRLLLCSRGRHTLHRLNAFLTPERLDVCESALLHIALRTSRVEHTRLCIVKADHLLAQIHDAAALASSPPEGPGPTVHDAAALASSPPDTVQGGGRRVQAVASPSGLCERLTDAASAVAAALVQRRHRTWRVRLAEWRLTAASLRPYDSDNGTGYRIQDTGYGVHGAVAPRPCSSDNARSAGSDNDGGGAVASDDADHLFTTSPALMDDEAARTSALVGDAVSFEPQLVLFEHVSGLMLRREQVSLVGTFLASHERQRSLCHQMLMGAGKTTVIAPLLTLYLAASDRLIVEVVPASLLHFASVVMWKLFSSAAMPRPIFRCIHACICTHAHMHMYACTHAYVRMHAYACMRACVHAYAYICMCKACSSAVMPQPVSRLEYDMPSNHDPNPRPRPYPHPSPFRPP